MRSVDDCVWMGGAESFVYNSRVPARRTEHGMILMIKRKCRSHKGGKRRQMNALSLRCLSDECGEERDIYKQKRVESRRRVLKGKKGEVRTECCNYRLQVDAVRALFVW